MLEIINGFLLVYFIIVCALGTLTPSLVKPIAACFARPSIKERNIWADIMQLKKEQKNISMKDEFAAYSKLQRRINKLESVLKEYSQARIRKILTIKSTVNSGLRLICGLLLVFPIIWFRQAPIVVLNVDLFPLTRILGYPSNVSNSITTHAWVIITSASVKILLQPFTS